MPVSFLSLVENDKPELTDYLKSLRGSHSLHCCAERLKQEQAESYRLRYFS
jgi:hypothetical protein